MPIVISFEGAKTAEQANLPQRLKSVGLALLNHQDLGEVMAKADGGIEKLAAWTHKLDLGHWVFFFASQIPVLVLIWLAYGLTVIFVLGQTVVAAIISIAFQIVMRRVTLRRARASFKKVFGMGYAPTVDQIKRVRSVSKWMEAVGRIELDDGRAVVAVSVPALRATLFAVDEYRK